MNAEIEILRRRSRDEAPYLQAVTTDTGKAGNIAELLERINREQLADDPVQWECSCKQKKCGACAMLINGKPRLACAVTLWELPEGKKIRLEPLKKFPVIRDLVVDRSVMMSDLIKLSAWLDSEAQYPGGELAYDASRCLQCGCCLEVCPNFYAGGEFFGAAALTEASRLISEAGGEDGKRLSRGYSRHFYKGCGKSLSCRDICPAGIDTERLLVNSNAAAVWKRGRK